MLKFRRIETGYYQADTEERRYVVERNGNGWLIRVWKFVETAGVRHIVGAPLEDSENAHTKALAVDIVRRYDRLVGEGYGRLFTDMKPMTKAVVEAYEAEAAR